MSFIYGMGATLPYQKKGEMDFCKIKLIPPIGAAIEFGVLSDNSAGVRIGADSNDGPNINPTTIFNVWTTAINTAGDKTRLTFDLRPYETYYIDYPIGMSLVSGGNYTFEYLWNRGGQPAVTVLYLYDKNISTTQPVANLLSGKTYSFNIANTEITDKSLVLTDRFFIRMYGAHLSKENYTGNWNNTQSWQGETLPKNNSHVIINSTSSITINSGENQEIGYLTNSGYLENNGKLTVSEGVELLPGDK